MNNEEKNNFGLQSIETIREAVNALDSPLLTRFLKRNIICSHQDLDLILKDVKNSYLYTGRGPSSGSMHLGHLIPFFFTKSLQEVFQVPVVIQISDDEKLLFRNCSLEEVEENSKENIKDIIACGFQDKTTFIFQNTKYIKHLYPNVLKIQSKITNNDSFATFGVKMTSNIGQTSFCAIQAAPAFPSSFSSTFPIGGKRSFFSENPRCLVPCGEDQHPYFRLTRDVAPKLGYNKPSLVCCSYLPALTGVNKKMSSTEPAGAIFLTDTVKEIKNKINQSFSGGKISKEDQIALGADLEVDVAYQYLKFFLEDDEEFEYITNYYGPDPKYTPKLLSSVVKNRAIEVVTKVVFDHRERKQLITEEVYSLYTRGY